MTAGYQEKNKAFYDFLEMQMQLFKGHFIVTRASKDEEAIHQMRVAIKRIRTIQKLSKSTNISVDIPAKPNDAIKTIFYAAGNLRDLQIQTGLLDFYKKELKSSFAELENWLNIAEMQLSLLLDTTLLDIDTGVFNLPEISHTNLDTSNPGVNFENECLDFLRLKIEKINHLIVLLSDEEKVHKLRKHVKQLFFILQFLAEQFSDNLVSGYDLKSLKKITDAIGLWHDQDVFRHTVLKFVAERDADFTENHPEYLILFYIIDNEKQKLLINLDLDLYLEMIKLKSLFTQPAATPDNGLSDSPL